VHRRLLVRGRGGETLGVRLRRVRLSPSVTRWAGDSHGGPLPRDSE
jgi:hypothetical protein